MQTDEDVGKIARDTPVLMSRALELFVTDLVQQSAQLTVEKNSTILHPCYIKQCVQNNHLFDFLVDVVAQVPDTEPEPKRRLKKSRSKRRRRRRGW